MGRRIAAIILILLAVAWGAEVMRQVLAADGDGPPIGAIAMAIPSIGLLIAGGAVWPSKRSSEGGRGFEAEDKR